MCFYYFHTVSRYRVTKAHECHNAPCIVSTVRRDRTQTIMELIVAFARCKKKNRRITKKLGRSADVYSFVRHVTGSVTEWNRTNCTDTTRSKWWILSPTPPLIGNNGNITARKDTSGEKRITRRSPWTLVVTRSFVVKSLYCHRHEHPSG